MKLSPLDILFSKYIRLRADYTCEYCGSVQNPETKRPQMDTAHFKGRRYRQVRWDTDNAACLCHGCHMHMHDNPDTWAKFFETRLGSRRLEELGIRAEKTWPKVDKAAIKADLVEKIRGME